jgi:hypothetical protein
MRNFYLIYLLVAIIFTSSIYAASPTPTPTVDVKEKALEKIESVRKNPKAFVGSVTDKTSDTLQIQSPNDEIKLTSINPDDVSIVKTGKTITTAKYSDLAIGDFIIAMGFINDKGILDVKRIIISSSLSPITREVILVKVSIIKNKNVTVNYKNETLELVFPKKWKGPEIKELKVDDKIIVIGERKGNKFELRTIELLDKALSFSPTPTPTSD